MSWPFARAQLRTSKASGCRFPRRDRVDATGFRAAAVFRVPLLLAVDGKSELPGLRIRGEAARSTP